MGYLVAVVALLALVTLFNVVVAVGLVRRLRAHSDLLAGLVGGSEMLPVGTVVPEFFVEAVDGSRVDHEWLCGPAAVAFLAVGCPHCQTNLGEFVAYVRGGGYPRGRVLAVMAHGGDGPAGDDMIGVLASVATVARDDIDGAVAAAFSVGGFPTFYLVGADGTLTAAAHAVRGLPNTAVADIPAATAGAAG